MPATKADPLWERAMPATKADPLWERAMPATKADPLWERAMPATDNPPQRSNSINGCGYTPTARVNSARASVITPPER